MMPRARGIDDRFGGRSRRTAFTVLELLIVVAIIMLMVGIMVPSLRRAVSDAHSTVCMHNLKEIGQALHIYRIENDGWLPSVEKVEVDRSDTWFIKLIPRIFTETRVLACPEDPFRYRWNGVANLRDPRVADYSSYGLSSFILRSGNGRLANLDRRQPWRPLDTLLLADIGPDNYVRSSEPDRRMKEPLRNASLLMWDDGYEPFDPLRQSPWLTTRHGDGINVLTVGFAVRSVPTDKLLGRPIMPYYEKCDAGGCSLCAELELPHYNFSDQGLYWWTGTLPRD